MLKNSKTNRREYSEKLLQQVLAKLEVVDKPVCLQQGRILSAEYTVIVADISPYSSVVEADGAEMEIGWFSSEQEDRRRACRIAFAALELQYYLQKISCVSDGFEIVSKPKAGKVSLVIEFEEKASATDGSFEIRKIDSGYLFTGQSIQGPLYAVYEYAQQLGCNFLRPGRENEFVPVGAEITTPIVTKQTPTFKLRHLNGWRKNRALPNLIDWCGKGRMNSLGSDNLVPGMRKRGILLVSGMHDVLPVVGLDNSFCISDQVQKAKLIDGLIEAYANGPWTDADVADYIGADWGKRCDCGKCRKIGNTADIEVYILAEIRRQLHQAYLDGRLNRDMPVTGYSYFDCEEPPTNPMPDDFDDENIYVTYWVMRCWEHFIDESACSEDLPMISTMHDFAGQRMDQPSNIKIHNRLMGWAEKKCTFSGNFGFGYYFNNAGSYWLPICQMSIISYEFPYLHSIGTKQVAFMHIAPGNWGPKAAVYMLYSKLGWDANANPAHLLAKYFKDSYGENAAEMAKVYFNIENGIANVFTLKRLYVKGIKDFGFEQICQHSHLTLEPDDKKVVRSMAEMSEMLNVALASASAIAGNDKRGFITKDIPWIEYAFGTVELFRLEMLARQSKEAGRISKAKEYIGQTSEPIKKLKALGLEICLPEKIRVDCAEASGILDSVLTLADELDVDLGVQISDTLVQTSIEPVTTGYSNDGKVNPTRWQPDPNWPTTPDGDEIGCNVEELIDTGIKHMGFVAQRIDGQMLLASVGDNMSSNSVKLEIDCGECEILDGASVVCFTGEGKLLWRHDYNVDGDTRVNTGPWPAFVDMTGKDDWGVSVFVIEDGGEGKRRGDIYMHDAMTGKQIWKTQLPDHPYPGGNGSCVVDDIDGDGNIEIIYGLCNLVMCLEAQSGKVKWTFDESIIKICHGRLALCDVNADGRNEIIVATEYGDDKSNPGNDRSSILSLDGNGKLIRRMDNIQGDLGSTQIVITDVDNDGFPEIIHGSENLCFKEPRHMGQLMVKERWLVSKLDDVPVGGARFAIGDVDDDGYPEAIGITTYRDGGPYVKPEIFCVRVWDGRVKWRRPVSRVWLDGDAIMADVDGDGQLEAIVTTNYPSGYMHAKGTQTWSDLYILKGNGAIIYKRTFPDAVISPIAVDVDGDGKVEILVPCYDGKIYKIKTPGPACDADWPLVCQNTKRTGVYPNNAK